MVEREREKKRMLLFTYRATFVLESIKYCDICREMALRIENDNQEDSEVDQIHNFTQNNQRQLRKTRKNQSAALLNISQWCDDVCVFVSRYTFHKWIFYFYSGKS